MCPGDPKGSPDDLKMNNCIILIDAGYLSLISKFLGGGKHLKFDINKFSRNLAKREKLRNVTCSI